MPQVESASRKFIGSPFFVICLFNQETRGWGRRAADEFDSGQDGWQPEKRHTPLDSLVSLSQCIAQLRHQVNGLSSLQKRRKQRSSSVLSSPGSSAIDSQSLILDDSPKFLNCDDSNESLGRQLEEARYQISLLKEGNVELAAELGETKGELHTVSTREREVADRNHALEEEVKNMEMLLREKDSRIEDLLSTQETQKEPPRSPRCGATRTQSARARLVQADVDEGGMRSVDLADAAKRELGAFAEDPLTGADSAEGDKNGFESGSTTASDRTSDSRSQTSHGVPFEVLTEGNPKADAVDQCGLEEREVTDFERMLIERDTELDEMQEENERLKAHIEDLVDDLDVKKAEVYYLEEQVMRLSEAGNTVEQDSRGLEMTKGVGMACDGEVSCEDEIPADVGVGSRHITVIRRPSDGCSPGIKKIDSGFNEVSYAEFSGGTGSLDTQKQQKVFSGEANGASSYRAADQSDDSQSESCASEDHEAKGDVGGEDTSSETSSVCSSECSDEDSKGGPACQSLKHSVLRFHHLCVKVGCKMNECVDSVDNLVEYTKKYPSDKPHISDSVEENISELSELNGLFYKNWALLRPMLLDFIEGMDTDNADKNVGKPGELLSSSSSDDEVDDGATQQDADSASDMDEEEEDPGKGNEVLNHGLTDELDEVDLPCASNPIPAWQRPSEVPKLDLSRVILAGVNTRIGQNDKLVPAVSPSSKGEGAACCTPVQQKNESKVDWVIRNGVKVDANVAKIEQLKYENQLILHDYNNVVREKDRIAADLEAARFDICVLQNEVFRKDEEKRFMCGQLHQVRMENVKVTSVVEELEVRNNRLNENCIRITAENETLKICKEVLTTELDDARKSTHKAKRTIDQLSTENHHLKGNIARSRNDLISSKSHVEAIREVLGRTECEKRTILQQLDEKNGLYAEARDAIEAQTLENRRLTSELNRIQNSTGASRGRRGGHFEKRGGRGNGNFNKRC